MAKKSSAGNGTKKENECFKTELAELRNKVRESKRRSTRSDPVKWTLLLLQTGKAVRSSPSKGPTTRTRALVENIREGALTLSRTGTILYTNSRFADMTKLSADKVYGPPPSRFCLHGISSPDGTRVEGDPESVLPEPGQDPPG